MPEFIRICKKKSKICVSCEDVLKAKKESQPEGIDITTSKIEKSLSESWRSFCPYAECM